MLYPHDWIYRGGRLLLTEDVRGRGDGAMAAAAGRGRRRGKEKEFRVDF